MALFKKLSQSFSDPLEEDFIDKIFKVKRIPKVDGVYNPEKNTEAYHNKFWGTGKPKSNQENIKKITTDTTITEEQMQLKSQEGVSNTLKIMEGNPKGDALRAAVKNDPSLALQKEGKPNLGWSTVFDTVDADGQPQVLTRNQRKAWEMKNQDLAPKPEPPSAVNPIGDPVDKPLPGTGSRYNQDGSKRQLGVIEELPTPNQEASKQTNTQAFDGTAEGTQAGMNTIAAIAGGLNKLLSKPKEKGVVIPGLHESKDVQLVAAANPWDEFANLMG